MEKSLEVKNLTVSFRTQAGKVQAVRDISFDLYKGETLAIVGESGSGKSVTSKAIMGISAANAVVEKGEILYDGMDLVRIPEEEMHKLRGDKIAMVFQDPLSALDPIMRTGKQITEAMLLKNKANRKEGRATFNKELAILSETMIKATAQDEKSDVSAETIASYIRTFDNFNIQANKLANRYNAARNAAEELIAVVDEFLFLVEKKQKTDVLGTLSTAAHKLKIVLADPYFSSVHAEKLRAYKARLVETKGEERTKASLADVVKNLLGRNTRQAEVPENVVTLLRQMQATLSEMLSRTPYNFFRIGYYVYKNPDADLTKMPVEEANETALDFLQKDFMLSFLELEKRALAYSYEKTLENKQEAIAALDAAAEYFRKGDVVKKEAFAVCKRICKCVEEAIDPLQIVKDSVAYTFRGALEREVRKYFFCLTNNRKEEARFAKQTAKREALLAKGKKADWKVVPKSVVAPEEQLQTIVATIERVGAKFRNDVAAAEIDLEKRSVELVDYLKEKAAQVVYKLTKRLAKEKAIKLMEEVGIPEPRIRYKQYPFEFSGGMRQRIVIAIALSANPDILICDEPTTALDVTIQAQILELINRLKAERHLSVIFITHDLGVVANMADRIAVMYAGKIVEYGTANEIFYEPRHPYTWALLSSMPDLDTNEKLDAIPGTPPNMIYPPVGDAFAERNKYAMEIDYEMQPPLFEISPTHYAATWLLHPNAPKVEIPQTITDRIRRMKERNENGEK